MEGNDGPNFFGPWLDNRGNPESAANVNDLFVVQSQHPNGSADYYTSPNPNVLDNTRTHGHIAMDSSGNVLYGRDHEGNVWNKDTNSW